MKRTIIVAALLLCLTAMAQDNVTNIGVIPTPQQVVMGRGTVSLGKSSPIRNFVAEIEGAQNQRQAYRLEITPTGVRVQCVSN